MTRIAVQILAVSTAASMSGCASTGPLGADLAQGWRRAQVIDIVAPDRITDAVGRDCRADARAAAAYSRFAVVSDEVAPVPRTRNKHIVGIAQGQDVRVGNVVLINPADCAQPLRRAG